MLGGFALALMILATMINGVQAITVCEQCWNSAWAVGTAGPCANKGQETMACLNNFANAKCSGVCPGTTEASTVTCAGDFGDVCENNATGICTNLTWGQNCEANTTKICKDTQVPNSEAFPSICHVTCLCRY